MTVEELSIRINKKEQEVAKIKSRLEQLLKECDQEEYDAIILFVETGDREPYHNYLKSHNKMWGGDAWSKAHEYYDGVKCLDKYQKQLAIEEAKEAALNNMPEVLKEFLDSLIERWDRYDTWKREEIKNDYRKFSDGQSWKTAYMEMNNKWGKGWYDFRYLTNEQIHKQNVKAAESLVQNLLDRTTEICGEITDCKDLYLDSDNLGYLIINGTVTGKNGKARVESIGAGGYNIQRYHIRVLVKEVR